jgi:uncharacterized protein (DUF305 family)
MPLRNTEIVFGLLIGLIAAAEMPGSGMQFMKTMNADMKHMDRDMAAAPMNGNFDHDFAAMMLPHHRGAIEMAEAELRYGKDPVMRRLAQEIIVDQQSEVDAMQLWLTKSAVANKKGEK